MNYDIPYDYQISFDNITTQTIQSIMMPFKAIYELVNSDITGLSTTTERNLYVNEYSISADVTQVKVDQLAQLR